MSDLVTSNVNIREYQRRFFAEHEHLNLSGAVRELLDAEVIPQHQVPPEFRKQTRGMGIFDLPEYQVEAIQEQDINVREVLIGAIDEEIPDEYPPDHSAEGGDAEQANPTQ